MYDEIIELAENRAYLNAVRQDSSPNLDLLKNLKPYESLRDLEEELKAAKALTFEQVFHEPAGYYLLKCFLTADYSVDKAVFVSDVELYTQLRDHSARKKVAKLIYDRYLDEEDSKYAPGESVFESRNNNKKSISKDPNFHLSKNAAHNSHLHSSAHTPGITPSHHPSPAAAKSSNSLHPSASPAAVMSADGSAPVGQGEFKLPEDSGSRAISISRTRSEMQAGGAGAGAINGESSYSQMSLSLNIGTTNCIGVYGKPIRKVRDMLMQNKAPKNLFHEVLRAVLDDLRMDVFPRFLKSTFYKKYIQVKNCESQQVSINSFSSLRTLGTGAFGTVNACVKKDSGKLYAMKCLN